MPQRSFFSAVLAAGLMAGLTPAGAQATVTLAAHTGHTQAARSRAAAGRPPSPQPILLINGSGVVTGQAGSTRVLPGAAGSLVGSVQSLRLDGQSYEIPTAAYPYLGHGLDLNLFELSALQRMERAGRLPVRIGYRDRLHSLPGVTVTRSWDGTAEGYLTAASARKFGAALDRQFVTDHARGSYGTDGLFGDGTSISLAGTGQVRQAPVRPDYPMHTLTITATTLAGKPDTGDPISLDTINGPCHGCAGFDETSFFYHGVAKFSVPAGPYFAFAEFDNLSGHGTLTSQRMVILPSFRVSGTMTVHAAERTARQIVMVTPRPAIPQDTVLAFVRSSPRVHGSATTVGASWSSAGPLWVNEPGRPQTGSLEVVAAQVLQSPAATHGSYEYKLIHGKILTPASRGGGLDPRYVVTARDLATVTARYDQDVPTGTVAIAQPIFPGELWALPNPMTYPLHVPGQQTQYVTGNPSVLWIESYAQAVSPENFTSNGAGQLSTGRVYSAGERTSVGWDVYPLSTQPVSYAPAVAALDQRTGLMNDVSVGRLGNWLTFDLAPFSDNQIGHYGTGLAVGSFGKLTGSFTVDQDGKQVASEAVAPGNFPFFIAHAVLRKGPATITAKFDVARSGKDFRLSTASQTSWTWRSAPAPKAGLPRGWQCPVNTTFGGPATGSAAAAGHDGREVRCAPQPVLMPSYSVFGQGLNGSTPPGWQVLGLRVGYQQLSHGSKVTRASVRVSFDHGKTWRAAHMTGRDGNYRAVYPAPAGSDVTLRVSAANAAGSTVTQTTVNAYRVAGSQDALGPVHTACGPTPPGYARCFALYAAQNRVNTAIAARAAGSDVPASATKPGGLSATDIESAYKLPISRGSHQTVALVDAFSTPKLAADLSVYRKQYGLPPCTVAGGCLRIVNQDGKASPLPKPDVTGWGAEETLDVSMVSAACPHCRIVVVEATTDGTRNMALAEDTAIRLGATVVSNSYGLPESGHSQSYSKYYRHPGRVIVVASGDYGFGPANYPANLADVTAVGGTMLSRASNVRGWTERVWKAKGDASASGCSAYVAKPRWQHDPHCPGRTVTDVAAVAWNIAIYDSSIPKSYGGPWFVVGGTSAAAPLVAGVYALAGNASRLPLGAEYDHPGDLFDVTTGNNVPVGADGCGGDYLCNARRGYDGPTGLGTPDGIGDF